MVVDLLAVTETISIGVSGQWACAEQIELDRVRQPVGIRILVTVVDFVAVAVLVQRIRVQDVQFHAIAEGVPIRVNSLHVGSVDEHLIPVCQGIPVGVLWHFQLMQGRQLGVT